MPDILLAYGQESARGTLNETTTPLKEGKLSLAYSTMSSTISDAFRDEFSSSTKDGRLYFDLSNSERIRINSYFSDYAHTATCVQTKNSNNTKSYLLGIEYNHPDMESTPIYDTDVYLTATPGELAMKKLKITSTGEIKHIEFSRAGFNYLTAPASGTISFFIGSSLAAADSTMHISASAIYPGTSGASDIGTSSEYWKDAYLQNIINSTSAALNGTLTIKGGTEYTATIEGPTADATFYFPGTGGTFVTHATRGTKVGSSSKPVYIAASGRATACSSYAGGTKVTLNGTSKGASAISIYAPVDSGTATYVLTSSGENAAPVWVAQDALTGTFTALTSTATNNLSITVGGTKKDIADLYATNLSAAYGSSVKPVYFATGGVPTEGATYAGGTKVTLNGTSKASSEITIYAPVDSGTANYVLLSQGADKAPTWVAQTALTGAFTALTSTAAKNLSVTVGGTTKDITALYASALSNTSAIGGTAKPVYFNASGQPVALSATVGGTSRPVYLSGGAITACNQNSSGAWWNGGIPYVATDGGMEVGKYLDFHSVKDGTADYSTRILAVNEDASKKNILYLPNINGQVVVHDNDTQIGSGIIPVYVSASGAVTASASTVGAAAKPIYMEAGTLTAMSSTIGGAVRPIYMNAGTLTAMSTTVGSGTKPVYMSSGSITASDSSVGSATQPIYMSSGTITASTSTIGGELNLMYLKAGVFTASSTDLGSASKPVYVSEGTLTASDADIGSGVKPIYMTDGVLTASDKTIGTSAKPIYLSGGTITASTSTIGSGIKPIYMSSGTLTASGSTVGSGTQPLYMSSGTLTASTSTAGSTSLPVYLKEGVITACTASSVFSALGWTNGTTAGPTLSITIAGQERTAVIPSASASVSGIVTTGAQSFSGTKTFASLVIPTTAPSSYVAGQMWLA